MYHTVHENTWNILLLLLCYLFASEYVSYKCNENTLNILQLMMMSILLFKVVYTIRILLKPILI